MDLPLFGAVAGGPFAWMTEGTVDIDVLDTWKMGETVEIDMDWKMVLHDVRAKVPSDTGALTKVVAVPIVAYLNASSKELPISFGMTMNQDEFSGRYSLEAAGLWRAAADAMARKLSDLSGSTVDTIKATGKKAVDAFKGFMEGRRKKDEEEED